MPDGSVSCALRRLLELLAVGATVEDLSVPAAEARADGADPQVLADIEDATRVALSIQHTVGQHRRREAQFSALFDTAGDLAALRDLGAVLESIIRRARRLLGTDTAYLTLPDEQVGDTYVRVTDGCISPLFQALRVDLGAGLGGLVAQAALPYATPNYWVDERLHHTAAIDAGVLSEGLVAILGVPLLLGSRTKGQAKVVGVLFAADRTTRTFSPEEVALLCSLAAHAAIAIDTARALADARSALAELATANAVIGEHSAAMRRAEEAHDCLTDLVLRGGSIVEVATALGELLGGRVAIHDAQGNRLAQTCTGPDITPAALSEAATDSRAAARAVPLNEHVICAVLAGPDLLGSLVLFDRHPLAATDRRLFERASVVTALLLLLRRTVAETENRIRGDLLTDLLTAPNRDPAALIERGRRLGTDLNRSHLLLVAKCPTHSRASLAASGRQYLFGHSGISAEHGDTVVLLLRSDTSPGDAARSAAAQLAHLCGAPVTVAAAGPATGPADLPATHDEAVRCLQAMRVLGRTGSGACAAELGFLGVLLGDSHDVENFVGATLGPLLDYDRRHGTDLVATVGTYFACGANLSRAKDQLHIHVNTITQRLDRIQELLGRNWKAPDHALELQLALRLHRLATGSPGAAGPT